jgi:predicted RNase H-like HicB family nuclease
MAAGYDGMPRLLRCYAENKGRGWEAICLDLDIAVQAATFDEAFRELREAIIVYYETVAELPESERKRLFKRRAPVSLRVKFFLHALCAIFRDDDRERANFTCHCPA